MKLRYVVLAAAAVITIPTASAASLSLASQNLTPMRTCILSGYPNTDTGEIDAMVEQTNAGTNYGTNAHIEIETHTTTNIRTYIEFVLTNCAPKIPATATVLGATLRLYATALPATCRNEDIFPVTATWTEAGITWTNQPFGTTLNNPASGYTAQMQVGTTCTTNKAAGYVTGWTVTTDVQKFVAGSATNYGWMIRDDVEGSATAYTTTYEAKDGNSATEDPQLVISWEGA
ncbi:MAG: DNRLRE domain-containing protein [Candidatus Dormibacteria bacterium]